MYVKYSLPLYIHSFGVCYAMARKFDILSWALASHHHHLALSVPCAQHLLISRTAMPLPLTG